MKLEISEESYRSLREDRIGDHWRHEVPQWPYPLLFHGIQISRNIFFLDAIIEWEVIDLGKNTVRDASYPRYPRLNEWFHYRFFNGFSSVVNSAESMTLLPRLYRLKQVLLRVRNSETLNDFLSEKFAVSSTQELISELFRGVEETIAISERHHLLVWGMARDKEWIEDHRAYIKNVIDPIPTSLVYDLPHIRYLVAEWKRIQKSELKAMRRAEAEANKETKARRRESCASPKE